MKTEDLIVDAKYLEQETPMGVSCSAPAGRLANPEVPQSGPERKRWDIPYKLRIAEEAQLAKSHKGQLTALARREGLYRSTLTKWMQWRLSMQEQGLDTSTERKTKQTLRNNLKRLERENERLKAKLQRAEKLIELQKKVSRLQTNLCVVAKSGD